MKRILATLAVFALAAFATSCKSQLPPSPVPTVLIAWTAPLGLHNRSALRLRHQPVARRERGLLRHSGNVLHTGWHIGQAASYTDTTTAGGTTYDGIGTFEHP